MASLLGRVLAGRLRDGEIIGVGSGSTVEAAVGEISRRIAEEGLSIRALATSVQTALVAEEAGIEVLSTVSEAKLSWAFDGADEVDPQLNMIKGRGGAMLSEKIIARRAGGLVVIVSDSKLVSRLGEKHSVPIEVIRQALGFVKRELLELGACDVVLRQSKNSYGPVVTEYGNLILDARFESIVPELELRIKALPGVVESGLFFGLAREVLVERPGGVWSLVIEAGEVQERLISPSSSTTGGK